MINKSARPNKIKLSMNVMPTHPKQTFWRFLNNSLSNKVRRRERETQPWRHVTLEEQDARVSVNFTQKWQEKNKVTHLQFKKESIYVFSALTDGS